MLELFCEEIMKFLFFQTNLTLNIKENSSALESWAEDLKSNAGTPGFQIITTEEFAKN
jgi:hypothetical protein